MAYFEADTLAGLEQTASRHEITQVIHHFTFCNAHTLYGVWVFFVLNFG